MTTPATWTTSSDTNHTRPRCSPFGYDLTHTEVVRVEYEHDHGGGVNELPVTGLSLLGIAAAVIDRLKGWPLE